MSALLEAATLARLERLVALARRAPAGRRRRVPLKAGRGIEPGGRRDYAPGDDVRLLDWAAYARLERLLVKVTEALPESRLDLVLDGSGSAGAGSPGAHERQGLVAAAIAACAVAREVRVVVWWAGPGSATLGGASAGDGSRGASAGGARGASAGDGSRGATPDGSRGASAGDGPRDAIEVRRAGDLVRLLRFVAERVPAGPGRLAATAARIASRVAVGGTAVVLTDALDPDDAALAARRLRAAGLDPLVVSCAPGDEVGAGPDGDALRAALAADGALEVDLVDAETGARRRALLGPAALAAAGVARDERVASLVRALAPLRVPLERVAAHDPFEALATALLRR